MPSALGSSAHTVSSQSEHFFIVGCPRSGTTLLSVILDRHSGLAVPPETAFFDEVAPMLQAATRTMLFDTLRRWPRLKELALTPDGVLHELGGADLTPRAVLAAILRAYGASRGKRRCGEKTPQHLRHVPAIVEAFPEARILCLIRDGRDVALSLHAMPWGPSTLESAAEMWRGSVLAADTFTRRFPQQFRTVSLEALVTRPKAILAEVMALLGEELEPQQLSPEVYSGAVLPRSLEWKGAALAEIDRPRVDARRRAADPAAVALLERLMVTELARYGYVTSDI
jgi:hypothetical protein